MKIRMSLLIIALALTALVSGDGGAYTRRAQLVGEANVQRIKFRIVTIEEKGSARNILSESVVEGPPNTDFNINLEDERFKMKARFLTDLIRPDALKIRTNLSTRRFYGRSERDLPLYEEDQQSQSMELGFDEAVVLLPFGRTGGDHRLKIEITPAISEQFSISPDGSVRPLEINIVKASPGGIIGFEAHKIPHNFVVEVALLEDGRQLAAATSPLLIEDRQEIILQPRNESSAPNTQPVIIALAIERFARGRSSDYVTFQFDVFRSNGEKEKPREVIGQNWAGVASLNSDMSYDLSGLNAVGQTKKYELRFKFKLAPGERAN